MNDGLIRNRSGKYPLLEDILVDWTQFRIQTGSPITATLILQKANQIWSRIPPYKDPPDFNYRWLHRFRKRHGVEYFQPVVDNQSPSPTVEQQKRDVQLICNDYASEDIYSTVHTNLVWTPPDDPTRYHPTGSLPRVELQSPPTDPQLSRIDVEITARLALPVDALPNTVSVLLCTNAISSDRPPVWFISSHRRATLQHLNLMALGAKWVYRRKPTVGLLVMRQWLVDFYQYIGLRSVVLVLQDIYSDTVNLAPPPPNIRLVFLPCPPLDLSVASCGSVFSTVMCLIITRRPSTCCSISDGRCMRGSTKCLV